MGFVLLPDLSEWKFNQALGLGDKERNRKLREMRENSREARESSPIKLWGVWENYRAKKRANTAYNEFEDSEDAYYFIRKAIADDNAPKRTVIDFYRRYAVRVVRLF
jgi:hypothetical protein